MKATFNILSVFLCFNSVARVHLHYIYDEISNGGYDAAENNLGGYVKPVYNAQKTYMNSQSSKYQKYSSDRVVDAHFKVLKSSPRLNAPIPANNKRSEEISNSEFKQQWPQRNVVIDYSSNAFNTSNNSNGQYDVQKRNPVESGSVGIKPQRYECMRSNQPNIKNDKQRQSKVNYKRDNKQNIVEVNVRKTQISTDPQKKVRLNNNRQLIAAALAIRSQDYKRVSPQVLVDKNLQSAPVLRDHTVQDNPQITKAKTQNIQNRRRYSKGEYKKRDMIYYRGIKPYEIVKRSALKDNEIKYLGRDKHLQSENIGEDPRIGVHEEIIDNQEIPYALFYRTQSSDHQNGYIIKT